MAYSPTLSRVPRSPYAPPPLTRSVNPTSDTPHARTHRTRRTHSRVSPRHTLCAADDEDDRDNDDDNNDENSDSVAAATDSTRVRLVDTRATDTNEIVIFPGKGVPSREASDGREGKDQFFRRVPGYTRVSTIVSAIRASRRRQTVKLALFRCRCLTDGSHTAAILICRYYRRASARPTNWQILSAVSLALHGLFEAPRPVVNALLQKRANIFFFGVWILFSMRQDGFSPENCCFSAKNIVIFYWLHIVLGDIFNVIYLQILFPLPLGMYYVCHLTVYYRRITENIVFQLGERSLCVTRS